MCTDNMPSGTATGARRRDHDPRRHDGRGDQHRRRGSAGDGRRPRAGDRGARRRDRRHRHAHRRVHARPRHRSRRRDRQRPEPHRPGPRRRPRPPTNRCGSCPSTSATATSSTPTVADLKNLGGANAGAITAALFLAEFVGDVPWAHIDIAGTAQATCRRRLADGGMHGVRRPTARRVGGPTSPHRNVKAESAGRTDREGTMSDDAENAVIGQ